MTRKSIEKVARAAALEVLRGWQREIERELGTGSADMTYSERRRTLLMLETAFYSGYQQALRDEVTRIEHEQKQDRARHRLFGEKRR